VDAIDVVWDGVTQSGVFEKETEIARNALADAAKSQQWSSVLTVLRERPDWVNASRPGGSTLFAPLHQAAYGGAPVDVVEALVQLGAFRTLQNARGERPVDVAVRRGHHHLVQALAPIFVRQVPTGILLKLQTLFHSVIRGRIDEPFPDHGLRLPELEPLLELRIPKMWFPVPGMYGGFSYQLVGVGVDPTLISESWSRVAGGSGQRHEITTTRSTLVAEGFV
jgi:hypothetical protein